MNKPNKNPEETNKSVQVKSQVKVEGLRVRATSHIFAKNLRKNSTPSEKIFWEIVRNRKLEGKKFLRQYPIKFILENQDKFFIADFYCHEAKLIIELDGEIHNFQKDYDELRDYIISNLGIRVVRFKNEEIIDNIDSVIDKIKFFFSSSPLFSLREGI